jgi:hypothetical protein
MKRLRDHNIVVGIAVGMLLGMAILALVSSCKSSPPPDKLTSSETPAVEAAAASLEPSTEAPTETPTLTPSPTPKPTRTATATPKPSPTATAMPTRTSRPTSTATTTPTPTNRPTRTPRPTRAPTRTPTRTSTPSPLDCLNATYLADVTIPDYSHLDKGESFVKTWRVRNSGTCPWPEGTQLIFSQGHQMDAPDSVTVGTLPAGETTEISVDMVSPNADDNFQGTWRFVTDNGDIFGTRLTVVIRVGEIPTAVPTSTANPAAPAPPPPVPGGHIGGGFELGGQTHTLAHPNEMHYAGMTWVKFQHKWSSGQNPSDVLGRIQAAHANGLKVLLSIPGGSEYPSSIDFGGYVEFLRGVAALGPDAIEVWNEQNIDREWPAGSINPSAYVSNILAPAYNAIKSTNPNVMVISGAPAPTGYFGGCSGIGCDDAPYIAGMLAAGAANYVDCVGVHYNEGILPPSQTSGDPRGSSGHYTRYFWGMVNTYWANFGGTRKLCFTELGYVSPEGYPPIPPNFGWGAGTSVAEQAAWLAEAAVLSSNSGKVRLMIVYNVDFTLYSNSDPQAGYAIIRPGGGCPACETLHNVTH